MEKLLSSLFLTSQWLNLDKWAYVKTALEPKHKQVFILNQCLSFGLSPELPEVTISDGGLFPFKSMEVFADIIMYVTFWTG